MLRKTLRFIFLLGLFLMPLVFWPWATIGYEIPKVWLFQRWVEILGVLGVVGIWGPSYAKASEGKKEGSIIFGVGIFVLIALLSAVFGVNFTKSWNGNYYRADGLITLFHLAALVAFLYFFWEKSWQKATALVLAGGGFLISFWAILIWVLMRLGRLGELGRFGGSVFEGGVGATFGNPNFLAGYLLVILPFGIYLARDKVGVLRGLGVVGILIEITAIGLTLSKGGIAGVGLFALGWLVLEISKGKQWGKILLLAGTVLAIGFFSWIAFRPTGKIVAQGRWEEKTRERIGVKSLGAFLKRPVLGWGWANFDAAFESVDWPLKIQDDVYVDKAHSSLLEVLTTMGVLGIIGYLALVIGGIKGPLSLGLQRVKIWEETLLLSLMLFLFHSQTNVISINEEMIFWLILGMV